MKNIQNLIILLLVGLLIYLFILYRQKPLVIPIYHSSYDTVYLDKPFYLSRPFPIEVPIQGVTIYKVDSLALDSMKISLKEKDILIQGLTKEILISQNFLKQFPLNPKLLELDLSLDTLNISLLKTDGSPSSTSFSLGLSEFKYRWTNEGLTQTKVNSPQLSKSFTLNSFAGGGVNFLYFSPYVDLGLEVNYARIRLYSDIRAGLLKKEASSIDVGLKYRLNK